MQLLTEGGTNHYPFIRGKYFMSPDVGMPGVQVCVRRERICPTTGTESGKPLPLPGTWRADPSRSLRICWGGTSVPFRNGSGARSALRWRIFWMYSILCTCRWGPMKCGSGIRNSFRAAWRISRASAPKRSGGHWRIIICIRLHRWRSSRSITSCSATTAATAAASGRSCWPTCRLRSVTANGS